MLRTPCQTLTYNLDRNMADAHASNMTSWVEFRDELVTKALRSALVNSHGFQIKSQERTKISMCSLKKMMHCVGENKLKSRHKINENWRFSCIEQDRLVFSASLFKVAQHINTREIHPLP